MIVYKYHPETFEYICEVEADVNPFHKDQYIYPAYTTKIKPLEYKEGYVSVWVGNKWQYTENHIGEIWYNSKTKKLETIKFLGELPKKYNAIDSTIANPPEEPFYEYDSKKDKWVGSIGLLKKYITDTIDRYWSTKQDTPYIFENHSYLPRWRESYTSMYTALANGIIKEYTIKDNDGIEFTVNKSSMKDIYSKMLNVNNEMYNDKFELLNNVSNYNDFNKLLESYNKWTSKTY